MAYFERVELRTTDPEGARDFYRTLLGESDIIIGWLPDRARAAGAPSHWLGHLGVDDVNTERARWLDEGATPLGSIRQDGVAVLKDPRGSPVALAPTRGSLATGVGYCQLHTGDVDAAWRFYGARFGWQASRPNEAGPIRRVRFGYPEGPPGGIVETVGKTGAHPHWLFHFPVPDLDAALESAAEAGASVTYGPVDRGFGRAAAMDDPFGAAVGLLELSEG